MAKEGWGVCRHTAGDIPQVLEAFEDRDKCMAALIKKRAAMPETEKWKYLMLPLDKKGNGLLPPGVL
jgi:hypothetical protein